MAEKIYLPLFLAGMSCERKAEFMSDVSFTRETKNGVLEKGLAVLLRSFAEGKSIMEAEEGALCYVREHLNDSMFPFEGQSRAFVLEADKLYDRLLRWISASGKKFSGKILLEYGDFQQVGYLLEGETENEVLLISLKNYDGVTVGAKTDAKKPWFAPRLLHALLSMKETGKDIRATAVFLMGSDEKNGRYVPDLALTKTAGTHLITIVPEDCGDWEGVVQNFRRGMEFAKNSATPGCIMCGYRDICRGQTVTEEYLKRTIVPEEDSEENCPEIRISLTPSQEAVVASVLEGGTTLCAAPPGSGKTALLIQSIRAVIEKGVLPEEILAVTFTRAAAREMNHRLAALGIAGVNIMTINALANQLIHEQAEALGYEPRTLDTVLQAELVLRNLNPVHYGEIAGLSYGKIEGRTGLVEHFTNLVELMLHNPKDFKAAVEKKKIDEAAFREAAGRYLEDKNLGGYLNFEEQVAAAVDLLMKHPEIAAYYERKFAYIFLDEAQDTDPVQFQLIQILAGDTRNLLIVCDDDQLIYGFRGADSNFVYSVQAMFPELKVRCIEENFRSSSLIVSTATRFIRNTVTERIDKNVRSAVKGEEFFPLFEVGQTVSDLVALVSKLTTDGFQPGEVAVLTRKNEELREVHEAFSQAGIASVMARSLVREDPVFNMFRLLMRFSFTEITSEDLVTYLHYVGEDSALKKYAAEYGSVNAVELIKRRYGMEDLNDPESYQRDWGEDEGGFALALWLIGAAKGLFRSDRKPIGVMKELFAEVFPVGRHALFTWLEEKEEMDPAFNMSSYSMWRYFENVFQYEDDALLTCETGDCVALSTAHYSKGLEWPVVIIYGTEKFSATKEDEKDAENRLFYVAMTRAKSRLYLMNTDNTDSASSSRKVKYTVEQELREALRKGAA